MSQPEFQTLLSFFKALSNESRLKLVGILAQREYSVEELAALVQLKEPTVSHHLSKLKELNLVQMRPDRNTHFYRLNQDALQDLSKAVFTSAQITTVSSEVNPNAWEEKVLKNFLEGDRLREIPASRKKRWVVLKWLVNQFEMGQLYPERLLNEIIKRVHPDTATLRREMIGYRMMQRENGVYWREPESQWREELVL
ncbi:MAG: metalloregulator ArsR/SmtB family transcription factor [Plectolyngbya sp. WJT66-NPBG17]|jgi:DNA-binding transcriptional ArsR family regulator|nr:metalloregulator ArsR/SmtB family transcription factor [Plectolyngbya sp. WJT66-NPBG17]MBW4525136.1 metalloregulator ArsR/SmtB family transcription factor [Phormidium tanganyikae FI6-MK23]